MYLPPDQTTLYDALKAHCTLEGSKPWEELDEEELQRVAKPVRDALSTGKLTVCCVGVNGIARQVDAEFFVGQRMWDAAFIPSAVSVELEAGPWTGHLVVNVAEFDRAIHGSSSAIGHTTLPTYVPPFVSLMLDLVERFDLSKDYRFTRQEMVDWLQTKPDGVPKDLDISKPVAEKIVMFIANPATGKGGNPKIRPEERSPNPFKDFKDQTYPKKSRAFP